MSAKQTGNWKLEEASFFALVVVITLGFAWLMTPYFGAILWGIVAAIIFNPLYRRLTVRLGGREGLAATLTLLLIIALVIVPAALLGVSLVQEASSLYTQVQTGGIDFTALIKLAPLVQILVVLDSVCRLQIGLPNCTVVKFDSRVNLVMERLRLLHRILVVSSATLRS